MRKNGAYTITVEDIRSFMTFDYINRHFYLPEEYLQKKLLVKDKTYPLLSLKNAGDMTNTSESDFMIQVRKEVALYFATSTKHR